MKLLRLREKLNHVGLTLLRHGDGFKVTDADPVDLDFATLADVEAWMKAGRHANRLTEADDADWDAQFKAFCAAWQDVQCPDCEHIHPMCHWMESGGCCPSCGEGQNLGGGDMKIERQGDIVKLWLSAEDTRRWANRPGDLWPCSYIAGKTLFAEFHCGDLVDYALNGKCDEALDISADEFNAITSDFITGRVT